MKLYQALYNGSDPFRMFERSVTVHNPEHLVNDGVLLLHGGADISPSIYNQKSNNHCFADEQPSYRDAQEIALVNRALKLGMPIIGICRGAQLLCALDGGFLVQHIEGHVGGTHAITDVRNHKSIKANSCHHQMMKINKKHDNMILALSEEPVVGYEEDNVKRTYDSVPEVVYFPMMNAIGIQGHPEWMPNSEFTNYCADLINEFLLRK